MSAMTTNLDALRAMLTRFATMAEDEYQAGRKSFATEIGVNLQYLDREYKRVRKERFKDAAPKESQPCLVNAPFRCLGSWRGEFFLV